MVYVDTMEAPFGRMVMCHMIADSREELLQMADKIGVDRRWIQDVDTHREHFDICKSKKDKALKFGAVLITQRELCERILQRRGPSDQRTNSTR